MKRCFLSIFSVLITFSSFSQFMIHEDNENLKEGIYRNFEEFKWNSPSLELKYDVEKISNGYGFLNKTGKVHYGKLILSDEELKIIKPIYGFCENGIVYINYKYPNGAKLEKESLFTTLDYIGIYCYFEDIIYHKTVDEGSTTELTQKVINIETEKIHTLSKSEMKTILSPNSIVLKQFKKDSSKKNYKLYISEFGEQQ